MNMLDGNMSQGERTADAGATSEGAFDIDTRQRLLVFAVIDVLVLLIVLAIAFL